jgi:tricorn protease
MTIPTPRLARALAGALLLALVAFAPPLAAQDALWIRYPAISPDGQTIVFGYRGALWRVPSAGGTATPLTLGQAHDFMPVWSRDGSRIAFASDRYGNFDVFVMPAQGGPATRLTHHSANDFPSDFTPDGRHVVFASSRVKSAASSQFPTPRLPELYTVPVAGGRETQMLSLPAEAARFDRSGRFLVFQDRKGVEDTWRKHETSSVGRDLWLHDLQTREFRPLTRRAGDDLNPVLSADGSRVYYLSAAGGTLNVWRAPLSRPDDAEQITRFERHPVRFLSLADDGTLAYTHNGELYTQRPGAQPQRLSVQVRVDDRARTVQTLPVSADATEMAVSPNGREVAFVVRGEIFVASVEAGTTKRITSTPEQERSVSFSPDGRSLLYAAERNGSWNLYRTVLTRPEERHFFASTTLREEPLLETPAETFQPRFSPDGREVAFLEDRTTLRVLNLQTRQVRTVMPGTHSFSYSDGDQHYAWSPDGRWFLVQYLLPGYWQPEAGLVSADGRGEVVNLTRSGFPDYRPQWAMDGQMMLWFSSRDGLRSAASSGSAERDAYAQFFTREAWERFRLSKEEYELRKEAEEAAKKDAPAAPARAGRAAAAAPAALALELDGITDRRARLTIHSSRLADAVVTPDGAKLVYLAQFEKGHDLWVTDLRTRETKTLAKLGSQGGQLALDPEGKHVFVLSNGTISRVAIDGGAQKAIGFSGELALDAAAERTYMFEHAWRQVRAKFYDAGLHGADWDFHRAEYARFLPHVSNGYDFAELLGEMLGELNASHTGARFNPRAENADESAQLGLLYDAAHAGDGLRIAEVLRRGPLAGSPRVRPGVVLERIDGQPITPTTNVYPLLNRRAGRTVLLSLHDPATRARWEETVRPITAAEQNNLLYERYAERMRALTDSLSGGRVGYVHVRGMNDPSYRTVFEQVMGEQVGREALIVDTRFNGGGDLVEDLSNFLNATPYMTFTTAGDGRVVGGEPQFRWSRPSAVLVGEGNYSDAHCFPYAYQALGIGKVVGMPVPGTCTFVWWERLQDGVTVFGIPNLAVRGRNGEVLENLQLEPDVLVRNEPADVLAGRDQQLERAVRELLEQLPRR